MSIEKRVEAMMAIHSPQKVSQIHCFDAATGEWTIHNDEYVIDNAWSAEQLSEWVFVTVLGLGDNDAGLNDNNEMTTGTYNHRISQSKCNLMLEEYSDRGILALTILELA